MHRIVKCLFTKRCYSQSIQPLIDVAPEIQVAIQSNRAIVALESTIITHGMPYPDNLNTALQVENIVRQEVSEYRYVVKPGR